MSAPPRIVRAAWVIAQRPAIHWIQSGNIGYKNAASLAAYERRLAGVLTIESCLP